MRSSYTTNPSLFIRGGNNKSLDMKIKIKWPDIKATFDTDNAELIDLPACPEKHEKDAVISIRKGPNHMNYAIAKIHTGTIESSNALAKEICRRWNAFRKDGLQETDNIMATELARKLNAAVEANGDHPVINSLTMPVPAGDGFSYVVFHKGDDHFELE